MLHHSRKFVVNKLHGVHFSQTKRSFINAPLKFLCVSLCVFISPITFIHYALHVRLDSVTGNISDQVIMCSLLHIDRELHWLLQSKFLVVGVVCSCR